MSFIAIKWSYTSPSVLDARLSRSDLAVLRALCWFYQDKGRTSRDRNCFPSVAKIAQTTGLKASAVNVAKARLFKKGLVKWQRAANFAEKDQDTNSYSIDCPQLQTLLENNRKRQEEKRALPLEDDDFDDYDTKQYALRPGELYTRPDPASLAADGSMSLTAEESVWLADALAFVCDRPTSRKSLYAALRRSGNLASCRKTLDRVIKTSHKGRMINNRVGYLLKALRTGETNRSRD